MFFVKKFFLYFKKRIFRSLTYLELEAYLAYNQNIDNGTFFEKAT